MIEMTLQIAQDLIRTAPSTPGLAEAIADAAFLHPEQETEWGSLGSALFVALNASRTMSHDRDERFVSKPLPPSAPGCPTLFEQRMAVVRAKLATRPK